MLTQIKFNPKNQGPAYREFSRRRYHELKSQSLNLRESEIVAKVIRQWDCMTMEQKNKYSDMKKDKMAMLNVESISTPQKEEMPIMKAKTNQKTTIEKKVQMIEPSGSQNVEEIQVQQFDETSPAKGMKNKKITHPKNTNTNEYITFFKSYFKCLSIEHPNWSAKQTTSIIKLLWRKRKQNQTKVTKTRRLSKPMGGRKTLRKMKGLTVNEARAMWKRLPMESKRLWQVRGNSAENKMNTPMCMNLKLSQGMMQSQPMMTHMNFLNRKMM